MELPPILFDLLGGCKPQGIEPHCKPTIQMAKSFEPTCTSQSRAVIHRADKAVAKRIVKQEKFGVP
jgi:hypothetical protein